MESAAPSEVAGPPARPSGPPPRSGWLLLSWFAFLFITVLPLALSGVLACWVGTWLLATRALLDTRGLDLPERRFAALADLGLALVLLCLLGAVARWWASRGVGGTRRQRVLGPGGRVLRVFHQKDPDAAPAQGGLLAWVPDLSSVLLLCGLCLLRLRGSGRWLPAGVCVVLIIASLHLVALYAPRLAWKALRLSYRLYRFAAATPFRAGVFTILFALPPVLSVYEVLRLDARALGRVQTSEESAEAGVDPGHDVLAEGALTLLEWHAMLATADRLWAGPAFEAEVRRFLAPLFHAARDPYGLVAPLSAVSVAWADPVDPDAFGDCVRQLFPSETRRAERNVRRSYRLTSAQSLDLVLQALVSICENQASRASPYPNLPGAYWKAVGRAALKQVDPTRKHRREVPSSALGATFVDCAGAEDLIARCPSPYADPEERLAAFEEIATISWCGLDRQRRLIILQKAVLGMSDEEIAAAHDGLQPGKVKDLFQNARRKLIDKLAGACRGRSGWSDLLEGLP